MYKIFRRMLAHIIIGENDDVDRCWPIAAVGRVKFIVPAGVSTT